MPTHPKSISINELSGAVNKALERLKIELSPDTGPWPWINPNPPIINGLLYRGPLAEANQLANAIAKEVTQVLGTPMTPVVQEGAEATEAVRAALPPRHVILGLKFDRPVSF